MMIELLIIEIISMLTSKWNCTTQMYNVFRKWIAPKNELKQIKSISIAFYNNCTLIRVCKKHVAWCSPIEKIIIVTALYYCNIQKFELHHCNCFNAR